MSDFLQPNVLYSPWNSPGQNTGVSSLSLLQGIFPNQGSNPGLPHCRQIIYQLSHKGSPYNPHRLGRYQLNTRSLSISEVQGTILNNKQITFSSLSRSYLNCGQTSLEDLIKNQMNEMKFTRFYFPSLDIHSFLTATRFSH